MLCENSQNVPCSLRYLANLQRDSFVFRLKQRSFGAERLNASFPGDHYWVVRSERGVRCGV